MSAIPSQSSSSGHEAPLQGSHTRHCRWDQEVRGGVKGSEVFRPGQCVSTASSQGRLGPHHQRWVTNGWAGMDGETVQGEGLCWA